MKKNITTYAIISLLLLTTGCDQSSSITNKNITEEICKNDNNLSNAYSSGWSAGFQKGTHNNIYHDSGSRQCYELGYTIGQGEILKNDIQQSEIDSYSYISCLSTQLLNPNLVCVKPPSRF